MRRWLRRQRQRRAMCLVSEPRCFRYWALICAAAISIEASRSSSGLAGMRELMSELGITSRMFQVAPPRLGRPVQEAHQLIASCWERMQFDFDRVSCGAQYALFLALDWAAARPRCAWFSEVLGTASAQASCGVFRLRSLAVEQSALRTRRSIADAKIFATRMRMLRAIPVDGSGGEAARLKRYE